MSDTPQSLLERLRRQPDSHAWNRLIAVYTPMLRDWLRRHDLQESDADDLIQETLTVVVRDLPSFQHNQRQGAFRRWLKTILVHRVRNFWRSRQAKPPGTGDSEFANWLDQLEDPNSSLSKVWDDEHDRHVVHRLMELIRPDFTASTWTAFRRATLEGQDEEAVAKDLGISVNAVFIAKSRVLCRLRKEMEGLIDELA